MVLLDFLQNCVIAASVAAWLLTQIMKFFVAWIVDGKPNIRRLFGDGGMPSAHSATVVCMTVMIGYTCGVGSPVFGLAFIFAIVVMHDATGVRREAGKHAALLIEVMTTLNGIISERDSIVRRQKLKTMVGHTPMQVFFGALFGIVVAFAYILIFGIEYGAYHSMIFHKINI